MGIVELDGDLLGQGVPFITPAPEPRDDVGQRAGDEEVLLDEPEVPAAGRGVVGIEDAGERLGGDFLVDSVEEITATEFTEVEVLVCRGPPEAERIDVPAAVTGDRPIVRDSAQERRHIGNHDELAFLHLEGATDRDLGGSRRPRHFPGVGKT